MSNKEKEKKKKDLMDKNIETKPLTSETATHDKKDSKILQDLSKNDIQGVKEAKVEVKNNVSQGKVNQPSNKKKENQEIIKSNSLNNKNLENKNEENIIKSETIAQNDIEINIENKNSLLPSKKFEEMNTSLNEKENQNNNKSIDHSYDVLFENNTLLLSNPNSVTPTQPSPQSIFSFTDIHPEPMYHLK